MEPSLVDHLRAGWSVKAIGWTEHRDITSFNTSGGTVDVRKGDIVMVVVVRRWEDVPGALAEIAGRQLALIETKPTEDA